MMFSSTVVALSALTAVVLAIPARAPGAVPDLSLDEVDTFVGGTQKVNFSQSYLASGANVQYLPNEGSSSFTVNYNTTKDFVVGLGWQPGDSSSVSYNGAFSSSGIGILSVYGWSTDPLIEYYIMETSNGYQKPGSDKGLLTSDGGTYEIYDHIQVNPLSTISKSGYRQFLSIRTSPRTSGTVTVKNHFNAWAALGMDLGTLNFQILAVESWNGTGKGHFTVSKGTSSSGATGHAA